MQILIIKTSSFGDIVHTFPAITDAINCIPNVSCDWVVEENFTALPALHPAIKTIIPIALRRWKHSKFSSIINGEISAFWQHLRRVNYDVIIDAQGLLKSAVTASLARGLTAGFNYYSARESIAGLTYHKKIFVAPKLHAIQRLRELFARALEYSIPTTIPNYGLVNIQPKLSQQPYIILIPFTTWSSKHWPTHHWIELIKLAVTQNYLVFIPYYTEEEQQHAREMINLAHAGVLLPRQHLIATASWLKGATSVIGIDTGLTHLAVALNTSTIMLYGPTAKQLTGAIGIQHINLQGIAPCVPCYRRKCNISTSIPPSLCLANISPTLVWEAMMNQHE